MTGTQRTVTLPTFADVNVYQVFSYCLSNVFILVLLVYSLGLALRLLTEYRVPGTGPRCQQRNPTLSISYVRAQRVVMLISTPMSILVILDTGVVTPPS